MYSQVLVMVMQLFVMQEFREFMTFFQDAFYRSQLILTQKMICLQHLN